MAKAVDWGFLREVAKQSAEGAMVAATAFGVSRDEAITDRLRCVLFAAFQEHIYGGRPVKQDRFSGLIDSAIEQRATEDSQLAAKEIAAAIRKSFSGISPVLKKFRLKPNSLEVMFRDLEKDIAESVRPTILEGLTKQMTSKLSSLLKR